MHYPIVINLVKDEQGIEHALPPKPIPPLKIWDTVLYSSPDGQVRIRFPGLSPFLPSTLNAGKVNLGGTSIVGSDVHGQETLTVRQEGQFECQCFIKPEGRDEIGWKDPASLQSGGVHDVGH